MSLINDALKRAKQAQRENPSATQPELPLIPAGPAIPQSNAPAWLWPAFFTLLLGACVYLIWQSLPQNNPTGASASSSNAILVVHAATPPQPTTNSSTLKTNAVETQVAIQPAPLKLQSIVYLPGRSSIMIGGKLLSVGDYIDGLRVMDINPSCATLANSKETRILKLP